MLTPIETGVRDTDSVAGSPACSLRISATFRIHWRPERFRMERDGDVDGTGDGFYAVDEDLFHALEILDTIEFEEEVREYPHTCEPREPSWRGPLRRWNEIIARENRSCRPMEKAMLLWKHVAVVDGVTCVWLVPDTATKKADHQHLACIRGFEATRNARNNEYRREIVTEMDPGERQKAVLAFLEEKWEECGQESDFGR